MIKKCVLLLLLSFSLQADEWKNLLDKDLSQWEIFMGVPHESVKLPDGLVSGSKDGKKGTPLGLNNDPLGVFQVVEENGEQILKISGEVYGGLTSKEEFENYHFKCEFRWGEKKWAPRLTKLRDSGILYHCVGEHGKFWNVWKQSLECQVQEGDCGDYIGLAGAQAKIPIVKKPNIKRAFYSPEGKPTMQGYVSHGPSKEYPNGEWNTIEIYTIGQSSVLVVNGTPNMVVLDATAKLSEEERKPLTKGQIQIQSEGAELEYRRVKLRQISEFPEELKKLIK